MSTSQQSVFVQACRQEKTPYIPIWFMRQAGRSFPEYRKLKETYDILTIVKTPELAAKVALMPVDTLHVDAAILFADIMTLLLAMDVDLEIVEGVGPVINSPVKSNKDIEKLTPIDPEKDLPFIQETIRLIQTELKGKAPLIGFSGAPFTLASYLIEGKPSREFIKTKSFMYTNPRAWERLMTKLTDATIVYLSYQVASGVQVIQLFDSWAGYLSEVDYSTDVLPHSKRIFAELKRLHPHVPLIHFGTNTAAFLDPFASVDCDVVGIDWRMSIAQAWEHIGNKAIQGNLDPVVLLSDFAIVKQQVDILFDSLPKREGYIFNVGHGVLPDTPVETLKRLVEYVHEK